jgi:hypothetical protein
MHFLSTFSQHLVWTFIEPIYLLFAVALVSIWCWSRWMKIRREDVVHEDVTVSTTSAHPEASAVKSSKSKHISRRAADKIHPLKVLSRKNVESGQVISPRRVKQPYDAFLVLDVEATCIAGTDMNWPNEIIVSAVLLLPVTFLRRVLCQGMACLLDVLERQNLRRQSKPIGNHRRVSFFRETYLETTSF